MSFSGSQSVDVLQVSQAAEITVLKVLCRHFGRCAVDYFLITVAIKENKLPSEFLQQSLLCLILNRKATHGAFNPNHDEDRSMTTLQSGEKTLSSHYGSSQAIAIVLTALTVS